ncbi:hypothetical protein GGS23DRAFT_255354 [Durotheca rogersii]|uniref:uncharacterized protein n=1 Tax=Durotheca rogersii TaxID=419775 RepID=UPI00221F2EB5|nr:uncharacterized protein GGS23DRAFT_255354 [Durotheca rogersii]KAI5859936.1 hypothetical protein GGS23DRAFT_255354 [Durotheca rogersii]
MVRLTSNSLPAPAIVGVLGPTTIYWLHPVLGLWLNIVCSTRRRGDAATSYLGDMQDLSSLRLTSMKLSHNIVSSSVASADRATSRPRGNTADAAKLCMYTRVCMRQGGKAETLPTLISSKRQSSDHSTTHHRWPALFLSFCRCLETVILEMWPYSSTCVGRLLTRSPWHRRGLSSSVTGLIPSRTVSPPRTRIPQ